jgi:hypothetical protein
VTSGGHWLGVPSSDRPDSGPGRHSLRMLLRPHHLPMRLRLHAERLIIRGDAEEMGLRSLDGRSPLPWPWQAARFGITAADHADLQAGAAAVWVVLRPYSRHPRDYLCLYERDQHRWQALGASSCIPVGPGLLGGRPSAATSGPAALLVPGRGGASMAGAWRADKGATCRPTGSGWIVAETFRVSAEVQEVRVGPRRINVPGHGYFVVVWRSTLRHFPSARPPITCLDSSGTVLTRLNAGKYVDSATLESTAGI